VDDSGAQEAALHRASVDSLQDDGSLVGEPFFIKDN
jgi:hypothetical protein